MKTQATTPIFYLILGWLSAIPCAFGESYHVIEVRDLDFAPDQANLQEALQNGVFNNRVQNGGLLVATLGPTPRIRLPEKIEAYLARLPGETNRSVQGSLALAVRLEDDQPLNGFVDLIVPAGWELRPFAFTLDRSKLADSTAEEFAKVRRNYYESMGSSRLPGAAWFRHREHEDDKPDALENNRGRARRVEQELSRTFAMFSGGRAIAENLALDRELILGRGGGEAPDVPIADLKGITVKAIDWKDRLPEDPASVDPLAHAVPLDQHALFLSSVEQLFVLIDLIENEGAPVVQAFDVRNPFRKLASRYLAQLGLDDREALRQLPVKGLVITGGDPFLPTGSDVALLFETDKPKALFKALAARIESKAAASSAKPVPDEAGREGVQLRAFQNPERSFCSHVIRNRKLVAVTSSPVQIARLLAVQKNKAPSLGASDEFAFFRHRYPRGADESAFVFLSDATIRRWCGPRLRIAASRRTRAIAALGELTARRIAGRELGSEFEPLLGKVSASEPPHAVLSEKFGSLGFVTPVSELAIDTVSAVEKTAYDNWRRGYESGWARVFDPIAIRLALGESEHHLDLTVLPLTSDSAYRQWIATAGRSALSAMARHPHPESLLFASFAVDSQSVPFQQLDTELIGLLPGLKVNPLAWVGQSVSVFLEKDFFWKALARPSDRSRTEFLTSNFAHLPLGVRVESKSGIKLALFLTALKGLAQTAAPGLLRWETRKHGERPYVAIIGDGDQIGTELAIYYAPMPKALLLTLDEGILRRAMDRENEAASLDASTITPAKHALLQTSPQFLETLGGLLRGSSFAEVRRMESWRALPILNEWHRRSDETEPIEFHRQTFAADLACPGGKGYRWNAEAMTMESVAYGYPAGPRNDAAPLGVMEKFNTLLAGLGFEDDGLRLRASIAMREPVTVKPPPPAKELGTAAALALTGVGTVQKFDLSAPDPEFTKMEIEVLAPGKRGERTTIRSRSVTRGGTGPDHAIIAEEVLDDGGLSLVSESSDEEKLRYSKPLSELPAVLVQGQTSVFEYAYASKTDDGEFHTFGEVRFRPVGLETITVPAGTFENCVRVESTDRAIGDGSMFRTHVVSWYKEGMGAIKVVSTTSDGTFTSELAEHRLPAPSPPE